MLCLVHRASLVRMLILRYSVKRKLSIDDSNHDERFHFLTSLGATSGKVIMLAADSRLLHRCAVSLRLLRHVLIYLRHEAFHRCIERSIMQFRCRAPGQCLRNVH